MENSRELLTTTASSREWNVRYGWKTDIAASLTVCQLREGMSAELAVGSGLPTFSQNSTNGVSILVDSCRSRFRARSIHRQEVKPRFVLTGCRW